VVALIGAGVPVPLLGLPGYAGILAAPLLPGEAALTRTQIVRRRVQPPS
jgi:hypothetical protein